MYRIAVIGAGQLGGRHLQGLVRIEPQSQYFVVDPSTEALQTAHTRVQETGVALAPDQVIYLTTLSDLPSHLDYVVVATAADVRLNVLKKLLAEKSVSNLLLEKVLFQHIKDYQAALDLFEMLPTKVWVNCPRRVFPIYQTVKNFFSGQQLLQFQASGGNWGLGCNSVHFLDLIGY
ncbi:MAG: Gfo/Idh/MocA family oxidoreductase, partial [Paucibacter sp.]|nr:Gfo/Idh/MocA family oxidoreductase [Roseateles sp.]